MHEMDEKRWHPLQVFLGLAVLAGVLWGILISAAAAVIYFTGGATCP